MCLRKPVLFQVQHCMLPQSAEERESENEHKTQRTGHRTTYQNHAAYGLKSILYLICLITFVEEELTFNTQNKVGKIKDCSIKPRELKLCSRRRKKTLLGASVQGSNTGSKTGFKHVTLFWYCILLSNKIVLAHKNLSTF